MRGKDKEKSRLEEVKHEVIEALRELKRILEKSGI